MADITNTSPVVTEDKLKDFYEDIKPFLGCPAYLTSEGNAEYYSTEEKVIGRWTDGKPLYQKVIYFNPQITIAANSWQNIKSDETNIECIADAIMLRNDGIFIPQYGSVSPFISTRGLWVYTTQLQNSIQGIILKYTKITDSATTTTQSDPNEYSTDEKIIGKWVDGKPIYQKIFTTTTTYTFTNSWQDTSVTPEISTTNIDLIIEATLLRIKNKEVINCTRVAIDNNNLYLQSAITFNVESGSKIILRYTKTTD